MLILNMLLLKNLILVLTIPLASPNLSTILSRFTFLVLIYNILYFSLVNGAGRNIFLLGGLFQPQIFYQILNMNNFPYLFPFSYIDNIESFETFILLSSTVPIKVYHNMDLDKNLIIQDNKNKSSVYQFINLLTSKSYVGSSTNLSKRFIQYYNYSFISNPVRGKSIIYSSLLNNGYSNFSLIILEYCDESYTISCEQYYIDLIVPTMNILKLAGSSLGFKHSKEAKELMRINNIGSKNPMFGRSHSIEYKETLKKQMSNNNHMAGKPCSEEVKAIIRKVQSIPLYVYDANTKLLLFKFDSQKEFLKTFKVSDKTLIKYVSSGKVFREQYILSNIILDNNS
jgi:group I intron endonuclease